MAEPKRCLLRYGKDQYGLAASSLRELRRKAGKILPIDKAKKRITLVLAKDGTVVDDEDYFLCLPSDTKFEALVNRENWSGTHRDSGIASFPLEEVDGTAEKWKQLATQLRNDLSSIILMSEEDLQVLIDVPCSDLAKELAQSQTKVQGLQGALQHVLDRREEERQSREVLKLYLETSENENSKKAAESKSVLRKEMDLVDTGTSSRGASLRRKLSDDIYAVLKKKSSPELFLNSKDLELVLKEDTQTLASDLGWHKQKAEALQQACNQELSKRLEQVQALHSLRKTSKGKKMVPRRDCPSSKRKK